MPFTLLFKWHGIILFCFPPCIEHHKLFLQSFPWAFDDVTYSFDKIYRDHVLFRTLWCPKYNFHQPQQKVWNWSTRFNDFLIIICTFEHFLSLYLIYTNVYCMFVILVAPWHLANSKEDYLPTVIDFFSTKQYVLS